MLQRSECSGNDAGRRGSAVWRALVLGILLGGSLAAPCLAQEEPDVRDGFSVFVEAAPHVSVQRARGSVDSNFGSQSRKANVVTNMTFRLGGGFKAPALSDSWGRPRPVAYAAALIPLNESSTIGKLFVKETPLGSSRVQSAKYSIEYQTSATAGLGVEFMVPVFDIEIAVTPAIESLHLISRYVGDTALKVTVIARPELDEDHSLRGKQDITQHFLGPALRLSTPTAVFEGGIAIDFFLHSSVLFDVAGTRERFVVNGANGDSGSFNFETGTGVVQIASGFQVRWP
jgi:hypothetical protein